MSDPEREPCPYRIFEDMGSAFLLGAVGGGVWHFFKGYRNAPKHARWGGALTAARMRSPILGGNFGVWGGLFSIFDCSLAHYRGVEDPWNAIMSGGLTGGLLAARAGPKAIARNAVVGAVLLALIEGVGLAINKAVMKMQMDSMVRSCDAVGICSSSGAYLRMGISWAHWPWGLIRSFHSCHPISATLQGAAQKVDTLDPPVPPGFGSKVLDAAGSLALGGLGDGHSFELR